MTHLFYIEYEASFKNLDPSHLLPASHTVEEETLAPNLPTLAPETCSILPGPHNFRGSTNIIVVAS